MFIISEEDFVLLFVFFPATIKTIEELKMPKILHTFCFFLSKDLFWFCGPTGHGKSTTLASIINEINSY
jgi:twitching motility protein PilT